MATPEIVIIAGPNGAGKTTFAQENFSHAIASGLFLNADEIEKTLSSKNLQGRAVQAGRHVLLKRRQLLEERKSFILETTLATQTLAGFLRKAKNENFKIILYYLWVPHPKLCDFRVKDRVSKGGHNIPLEVIVRRYFLGIRYFETYLNLADEAYIYAVEALPALLAEKKQGSFLIKNHSLWEEAEILRSMLRGFSSLEKRG